MKKASYPPIFSTLLILILTQAPVFAQKIRAGASMYLDFNLYHWYRQPKNGAQEAFSVGQTLNIIPIGGIGLWIGYPGGTTLGVEGGIDYMAFSFDTKKYRGLGAVSFPVLVRITQPFGVQRNIGIGPFISIGFGEQWSRNGLYARPQGVSAHDNPYFKTYVGEIALGMGSDWKADEKQNGLLAFFARVGTNKDKAWTLNFGLRAKLLINPSANKAPATNVKKTERLYQAKHNGNSTYFF